MARILGELTLQVHGGDGRCRLAEPLEYHVGHAGSGVVITAPQGFETQLASVPRLWRWLASGWQGAARAVLLHDYLYSPQGRRRHGRSRREADAILAEALRVTGCPLWFVVWAAVRLFGRGIWRARGRIDVGVEGP